MTHINRIIEGLGAKLHALTGCPVYVDFKKNNVQFPCFRLKLLDQSSEHVLGGRYMQEHRFDIWYILNDADEVTDGRKEIHEMAEALFMALEYITLEDGTQVRGEEMSYRVTDGILHFFVAYNVFVLKERPQAEKMQTLNTKGGVKHGG